MIAQIKTSSGESVTITELKSEYMNLYGEVGLPTDWEIKMNHIILVTNSFDIGRLLDYCLSDHLFVEIGQHLIRFLKLLHLKDWRLSKPEPKRQTFLFEVKTELHPDSLSLVVLVNDSELQALNSLKSKMSTIDSNFEIVSQSILPKGVASFYVIR